MSAYNDREKASSRLSYGSLFRLAGKLSCFGYVVMNCAERIVCHTVSNIAASNTAVITGGTLILSTRIKTPLESMQSSSSAITTISLKTNGSIMLNFSCCVWENLTQLHGNSQGFSLLWWINIFPIMQLSTFPPLTKV